MIFKKTNVIFLCGALLISTPVVFGQAGGETEKLLGLTNTGVINLVVYGKDKQEIAKGSALILTKDIAATSYHLISQGASAVGFNFKKKEVDIDGIVAVDKALDLALIKVDGKVTPLATGGFNNLAVGKSFYVVGANETGDIAIFPCTVRNLFDLGGDKKVADTAAPVPETISGGVAIDEAGKAVGLVQIIDRRLRFVVPISAVSALPKTAKMTAFKSWQAEDYFTTIESYWLTGRLYAWLDEGLNAQRGLEKVTQAQPVNLEAWSLLARVYDRSRDYQNALTAYKKITELDPKRGDAYSGLGQIYVRMMKSADAVPALLKALELNPDNKEAAYALGEAYENDRQFPQAGDAYEKYITLKPENVWMAYQRLGTCRLNGEQFDQAAAAFSEALKSQPKDQRLMFDLAQSFQKGKKLQEAEDAYKKLAELAPGEAEKCYGQILRMYGDAQKPDKALEAAKKIVEIKPKDEVAIYNLGYMYQQVQKYQEAIEAYKQALAVKPNYDIALFQIGACLYNLKRYAEALDPFKRVVEIDPSNAYGWLYLGISNMQLKKFEAALDPLKKTVELQPDNPNAWYNLGICYLNLKDNYSARDVVKKLQGIDAAKAKQLQALIK